MTVDFEPINEDIRSAGRPILERTHELRSALRKMQKESQSTNKCSFIVKLATDEKENHFSRFLQRCRSAASMEQIKISVSNPHDGETAKIRILS